MKLHTVALPGRVVHSSTSLHLLNKVIAWRNKDVSLLETLKRRIGAEAAFVMIAVAALVEALFDAVIILTFTLILPDNNHLFKRLNNTSFDILASITSIVYLWRNPLSAFLNEAPMRWEPEAQANAQQPPQKLVDLDADSSDDE